MHLAVFTLLHLALHLNPTLLRFYRLLALQYNGPRQGLRAPNSLVNQYQLATKQALNDGQVFLPIGGGQVIGYKGTHASRYTLPYALSPTGSRRFQPPKSWVVKKGQLDASSLPPSCPQSSAFSASPSVNENCLFMNVFVPNAATASSNLPVFVWLHGGSFVAGSTSDEGLDGSALAYGGSMIVITLQYRLGMLGFLRCSKLGIEGNMGVRDVLEGLSYIRKNIAAFGGNSNLITLAGQSSGASLIKTLFTVPSADSLFQQAILQSAPLNYGDHSLSTSESLGGVFLSTYSNNTGSNCTTLECLQAADVNVLLAAQDDVFASAPYTIPGISPAEPIRPLVDGSLVTQSFLPALTSGSLTNKDRPVIFSTVKNEAGPTIAQVSQGQQLSADQLQAYVFALVDQGRAEAVWNSGLYSNTSGIDDAARTQLETLGTDWIWRCPNQQSAVNATLKSLSPKVYLAEFDLGISYPSNLGIDFCKDKVCHQDDIQVVFYTGGSNVTTAQDNLEREVLRRYSAFAKTGSPTPATWKGDVNLVEWPAISATSPSEVNVNMLVLTGDNVGKIVKEQRPQACDLTTGFWGHQAFFDEQIFS